MSEPITFELVDGVARITLNRPDEGNAIDQAFADRLCDIAHGCDGDDAVRVLLLTGAGRMFCAGGDIHAFSAAAERLPAFVRDLTASLHVAMARLMLMRKPIVAAVNGPAAGAGLGLALLGDVVLAACSATFVLAYAGIGLSPDAGTTYLLPRLIGLRRAQEMLFLGKTLKAEEARDWGLVTAVVDDAALNQHAEAAARRIAAMPNAVLGRSKRLLMRSLDHSLETQLEEEAQAIAISAAEPACRDGVDAFLNKRRADFSAR